MLVFSFVINSVSQAIETKHRMSRDFDVESVRRKILPIKERMFLVCEGMQDTKRVLP